MAITAKINAPAAPKPLPFPKLMESSNGKVYLMTGPTEGTLIYQEKAGIRKNLFQTGHHSSSWRFDEPLRDFHGSITLSTLNDEDFFAEGGEV